MSSFKTSLLAVAIGASLLTACNREATPAVDPAPAPVTDAAVSPPAPAPAASTQAPADAQMQSVLDALAKLGGKPAESLDPVEARKQPTPADAVGEVLKAQGKPTTPEAVGKITNTTFPGPGGAVPVRIYTPANAPAGTPLPVILYIHGGGWVIADLDSYDASPRAIANAAGAIVVSTHYRQGPEHKFPAAHDDTLAAYKWTLANAAKWNGDPKKIALVGESAGGNMAAYIAIAARDQKLQAPLHQVLIYPVANNDLNSPSYVENANAKPLNKPMIEWFVKHYLNSAAEAADPRIALVKQPNLAGLAPATIVLAQIDPLRSDGEAYAEKLKAAGTPVDVIRFDGVTHEFFGMGAVVDKAKSAVQQVGMKLKSAFAGTVPTSTTAPAATSTTTAPAPAG